MVDFPRRIFGCLYIPTTDDDFRPIEGCLGYRVTRLGEVQLCWSRCGRHLPTGAGWMHPDLLARH